MPGMLPPSTNVKGTRLGKYTLGNEIGKGGFGTVYECLTDGGQLVAVKRIRIKNLPSETLASLETEVSLLKKLNHKNIVQYIDTVRTRDHLHIVLEYMENGSLTQNLKKFGVFSQSLVALYIRQVLCGLEYLHDQGVIHRDIKGANILTTKAGLVKLADFGVATSVSDKSVDDVVGTPYWMAPEIIEMCGPTTACDIWSVGCTIVELLTGQPPYYEVPPMAALYRIVQDAHPPLPEGISPALREVLLLCFKKEPLLRTKASDLLRHRWVCKASVNAHEELVPEGDAAANTEASTSTKSPPSTSPSSSSPSAQTIPTNVGSKSHAKRSPLHTRGNGSIGRATESERAAWRKSVINTIKLSETELAQARAQAAAEAEAAAAVGNENETTKTNVSADAGDVSSDGSDGDEGDEEDEDWDDEFGVEQTNVGLSLGDDGLSSGSLSSSAVTASTHGITASSSSVQIPQNGNTITLGGAADEIDGLFAGDRDSSTLGVGGGTKMTKADNGLARFQESDVEDDFDFGHLNLGGAAAAMDSGSVDAAAADVFTELRRRMSRTNGNAVVDEDPFGKDDDGFDAEDGGWNDFEEDAEHALSAQQTAEVQRLIGLLTPEQQDATVLNACAKLTALFREHPSQRRTLLTHHGVIPIMEMLEVSNSDVLHAVLKVVNQIIENDRQFQELLSLAGLIPVVAKFAEPAVPRPIRLQAASLVKQFLKTSTVTLQMFVACGGLPVLVGLLDPNVDPTTGASNGRPDLALARVAVDGMQRVFQLSSHTAGTIPRNDFCRLFAKAGLLRRLIALADHAQSSLGEAECAMAGVQASRLVKQVAEVLLTFSHGDTVVKHHLAEAGVLRGVVRALTNAKIQVSQGASSGEALSGTSSPAGTSVAPIREAGVDIDNIKTLLRCMKNLSMDPSALQALETAGTVPTLVPFLEYGDPQGSPNAAAPAPSAGLRSFVAGDGQAIHREVMLTMFYLCRLNRARQEQAALAGIIPYLKSAIATRSPVKTFALQILCDLAHASDLTRDKLWEHDALDFFLDLLVAGDVFSSQALTSIEAWLAHAKPEVERALLRPKSLHRIVTLFCTAYGTSSDTCVKTLFAMLGRSACLAEAIGRSGLFGIELVRRLSDASTAEVRIYLLKILKVIGERHQNLRHFVQEHNLLAIVARQAEDAKRVVVKEIAQQLLQDWRAKLGDGD